MMSGSGAGCAWVAATNLRAGGTEPLSVSRESGHAEGNDGHFFLLHSSFWLCARAVFEASCLPCRLVMPKRAKEEVGRRQVAPARHVVAALP